MVVNNQQFITQLKQAQELLNQGLVNQAETLYLSILANDEPGNRVEEKELTLRALTQLYIQSNRLDKATQVLEQLTSLFPQQIYYCDTLANTYAQLQQIQKACDCYNSFIEINPDIADAFYNKAYHLKALGKYHFALVNYEKALMLNILQPEEVYLNMAVIYSDHLRQEEKAKQNLMKALNINGAYVPAIYNLANLYEEEGNKQQASKLFQKVIDLQPTHYQALARLADVKTFDDINDILIVQIKRALTDKQKSTETVDKTTRINLNYALGKIFDDCGDYERAFNYYKTANQLNLATVGVYDREQQESVVDSTIELFSREWFSSKPIVSDASPIFICGMFRSGSTLTEQILAAHPDVTAGGERDFFFRLVTQKLTPFSIKVKQLSQNEKQMIAQDYLNELNEMFPDSNCITDKRPDNFLYIGLIKTLFPNARIIYSVRNPLDNCLSVYFQRLGSSMNYAVNLKDIAHYYQQQTQLMKYWKLLFTDTIFEVNYDSLVEQPEFIIKELLSFLELEWSDNCLHFYNLKNRVKTASVWQVRQPLYKRSSGRWRHYENYVNELRSYFEM